MTHIYIHVCEFFSFFFFFIRLVKRTRSREYEGNRVCNSFSRRLFRLANTIVLILHCYRLGRVRRKYLTSLPPLLLCVFSHHCFSLLLSLASSFSSSSSSYICTNHDDNELLLLLKNNNNITDQYGVLLESKARSKSFPPTALPNWKVKWTG